MGLTLEINGVDRTDFLSLNSGRITIDLNGRSQFNGLLEERKRGYRPSKGQVLRVTDGASPANLYFVGNINRIIERAIENTTALRFQLDCWDYSHIAARRLVAGSFAADRTFFDVINEIVAYHLADEGVTMGGVQSPGPTLGEKLDFNFETAASVFNRISTITGYLWSIDFNKVLQFGPFTPSAAPFSITDISNNWWDLELERSDEDYRNRQYERSEWEVQPVKDEVQTAFAGQTSYPTSTVVVVAVGIIVSGISKTFAVVETGASIPGSGYDFYFLQGSFGAFALDFGPAAGGETVRIQFKGPATNVILVEDTSEQAARAAIEGGSGKWEAIEEQRNIQTAGALEAIGAGRLRQFGADALKIRFSTRTAGLWPGQRITINVTKHAVNSTFLIERLDMNWVAARRGTPADFLEHRVYCTSIEPFGRPPAWFEKVAEYARIGQSGVATAVQPPGIQSPITTLGCGEIPQGSGASFAVALPPAPPGSLILVINGVVQIQGLDYTLSGTTIALTSAIGASDIIRAWYNGGWSVNAEVPAVQASPVDNSKFNLALTPNPPASLFIVINGVVQAPGVASPASLDFVLSGTLLDYNFDLAASPDQVYHRAWYMTYDAGAYYDAPTGTLNGSNKVFTLTIDPSCLLLVLNGIVQIEGIDYSLDGDTVTYTTAPASTDWHLAWYKA